MTNSPAPNNDHRIAVTSIGMLTSLGQTAQACAAARAGFRRAVEWENYYALGLDEEFDPREPIKACPAPLPIGGDHPWERLVELGLPAIEEALHGAGLSRGDLARTSFSVCLSTPPDEDQNPALGEYFLGSLYASGALPPMRENRVYFQGHAAGGVALGEAREILADGKSEFLLLGGVESFVDSNALDQLDRDCRLKSPRAIDGYTPGEAAVFVVLELAGAATRRGARPLLYINAVGLANEPAPRKSKEVCTSQGLCAAVRSAVELAQAGKSPGPDGWTVSDFNGERHRAKEWGLALPRLNKQLGENVVLWHPAQNFGDVGSASTPLLLGVAARAFERGYAPRKSALVLASSDGPQRAAILVSPGPTAAA